MPGDDDTALTSRRYMPSMTRDYSRISDTARAVEQYVLPGIRSYLESYSVI